RGHVQAVAHLPAAADDVPRAFRRATVVGDRGQTDQLADDLAIDVAELGQVADEQAGRLRAEAGDRLQDAVEFGPPGVGGDAAVEVGLDTADLAVDPVAGPLDALARWFERGGVRTC